MTARRLVAVAPDKPDTGQHPRKANWEQADLRRVWRKRRRLSMLRRVYGSFAIIRPRA